MVHSNRSLELFCEIGDEIRWRGVCSDKCETLEYGIWSEEISQAFPLLGIEQSAVLRPELPDLF